MSGTLYNIYIYSLKFTVVNKMDGIFEKKCVTRIGDCVKVPLRYGSNEPMRKVSFGVKKSAVVESLVRSRRRLTTIKQQSVSGVNREQIRLFYSALYNISRNSNSAPIPHQISKKS